MQCVILAAGHGKRLRPYTQTLPKHLLEVNERPILEYGLKHLPDQISQVVLVIGWLGQKIRRYFGSQFSGRRIIYVEQRERLGTGHALTLCRDILEDKFLVMMGDNLYHKKDIEKCLNYDLCLLAREVENPEDFAVVEINQDKTLKEVVEKPHHSKSNLINTGLYILNKKFFDFPLVKIKSGEYGLPQTIAQMTKEHKVYVERASFWLPVDTKEDLERARINFKGS